MDDPLADSKNDGFRLGCLPILGIVAVAVLLTAGATAWWINSNFYASEFEPTRLSASEQQTLDAKLTRLETSAKRSHGKPPVASGQALQPERYTEEGADRLIELTERELNSLVANQPDIAEHVAIDLAEDLVSVKLLVPMDEDLAVLGGTTLRLNLGVRLSFADGRPNVSLQGVSIGGVPLPNAWLGGLKYKNLVEEFGTEQGFWKLFADGVENLQVQDGQLRVKLRE